MLVNLMDRRVYQNGCADGNKGMKMVEIHFTWGSLPKLREGEFHFTPHCRALPNGELLA